jgi:hypothetical protein
MKPDFWSSFCNQALLPSNNALTFGLNYENRFSIKELGTRSAGVIIPSGKASLGALYSHFGYKDFSRQTAALACGLKLSEKISAGVQIDYFSEKSPGTDTHSKSITVEGGLMILASDNIRIGIHIFNPVPNSIRKNPLPSSISAGAGINLNRLFFVSAGLGMTMGENLVLMTGAEYEAAKNFWLRGGFRSENTSFSFGFGYKFKSVRLDLAFATHESLGTTSSASLIFQIH